MSGQRILPGATVEYITRKMAVASEHQAQEEKGLSQQKRPSFRKRDSKPEISVTIRTMMTISPSQQAGL